MPRPPESRHLEALRPLAEFCAQHGYRWRWSLTRDQQWHAAVKIEDPAAPAGDRIVAWYASTTHDEIAALANAVRYSVEKGQRQLDQLDRYRAHVPGTI